MLAPCGSLDQRNLGPPPLFPNDAAGLQRHQGEGGPPHTSLMTVQEKKLY